jgi:hypothetical protein
VLLGSTLRKRLTKLIHRFPHIFNIAYHVQTKLPAKFFSSMKNVLHAILVQRIVSNVLAAKVSVVLAVHATEEPIKVKKHSNANKWTRLNLLS